jgi:aryl-alcohol dehydrogenase-like predicted oxidoreductase
LPDELIRALLAKSRIRVHDRRLQPFNDEGSSTMSDLPTSELGRTGATVTKLAYGAMELRGRVPGRGGREVTPTEAKTILNAVLDSGISLIDTSPDYGASEELIGEFTPIAARNSSCRASAAVRSTHRRASGRRTSSPARTSAPALSKA